MRRVLLRLVTSLVLGLITTIGVAWICAAGIRIRSADWQYEVLLREPARWTVAVYRRPGAVYLQGLAIAPTATESIWEMLDSGKEQELNAWPAIFDEAAPTDPTLAHYRIMNARGWPKPALWCELRRSKQPTAIRLPRPQVTGGVGWQRGFSAVDYYGSMIEEGHRTLPLRPLWRGLAVDTIVYASVWFVLLSLGRFVRGRIRVIDRRAVIALASGCLVMGVLSTVASAWICALIVSERVRRGPEDVEWRDGDRPRYSRWVVRCHAEPGALRIRSNWSPPVPWDDAASIRAAADEPPIPPWGGYLQPTEREGFARIVDARGWPMLAMYGCFEERAPAWGDPPPGGEPDIAGAIMLNAETPRILPLAPIWPGFAVDALFYGALWLLIHLLLVDPGITRRSLRHHHGRCLKCGYDLRGGPHEKCPECGT